MKQQAPLQAAQPMGAATPLAGVSGMDEMLEAKLWRNPCWFSFRLNYLALRYNLPLYDWVRRVHGLSRPEYVVLYSLALTGAGCATDVVRTSGFPKNTLSRAVRRIEALGLVERRRDEGDGRNQVLTLSQAGRALMEATMPVFVAHERRMLSGLNEEERATLARLMAKVVLDHDAWPDRIEEGRDAP
ncbi:MarR family winged helix-turn-helix transcriptional regulator [Rubrimonas cliftonensis]|uniref:DNA-binding transcriptional regulator, MarR family n=1 Tax=Rubrimonas cliftonensis TaxID=89524 RepID=A0A1H4A403_9RHOB|nr:MarR family winged helix-turn-helix transcriptional regulator [Rubrimonas cliftonensis]SEA30214.1 DNA-binding transcriptional regulator, MarR family [Rubrimonas cliftonensis]